MGWFPMKRPVNNSRVLDRLQQALMPDLRALGFDGPGRTLNRTTPDGLVQVVGFQIGLRSMAGQFTVNVGVFVPELARYTGATVGVPVDDSSCGIRARLGSLGPEGADRWWPIRDEAAILGDVRERLHADAMPFLDRFSSRDAILGGLIDEPDRWGGSPPRIVKAVILAARGRAEDARRLLEAQIAGTRVAGHVEYVRRLATELGLGPLGGRDVK